MTAWHDMTNVNFHCWNSTASEKSPIHLDNNECQGSFDTAWIQPPPDEIKAQRPFNVTYLLRVKPYFYEWAFRDNFFAGVGTNDFVTYNDAMNWCENVICPSSSTSANVTNCCIHHVNVHSCPKEKTSVCGPWLKHDGTTYTHSAVLIGPVNQINWTSLIPGIATDGLTEVIAHFKIANMQVALMYSMKVLPRTICGDNKCETLEKETCETCPIDCGKCPLKPGELAAVIVCSLVFGGIIIGTWGFFAYQKHKLLWDEKWIIPAEEIKVLESGHGAFGSMIISAVELDKKKSQGGVSVMQTRGKQMFATTCLYDSKTCQVRSITRQEFHLTKKIRLEVREVRECDCVNLCKFVGACLEIPHMAIINEYYPKGSLSDVLLNEEIPLSWAFRFSFESDISRGMAYLHSRKIIHGRLKTSNCVVDDRWTVKISDYGLTTLRANVITEEEALEELEYQKKRTQIYMAPEFGDADPYNYSPTMAGDVYAFAIILVEIAIRNDPYGDEDCNSLPSDWKPALPNFDPALFENKDDLCPCPNEYTQMIKDCWADNPSERPTFIYLRSQVKKINPSKLGPIDLMMAMMEKYSKHLEAIVAERTSDLVAEKAKTDRLLYSMLPKPVADDLRVGKPIAARLYDICTIYFSDIVGFTTISGASKPIEVVGLLNKLYITFDDIIDKYNVYKVETIGDAYMVVSGIPNITEFHAREMADMAIDLVKACQVFVIPHMPQEPLKIRVGLHTGPACAGVVGIKMPRYCLFGDTVNTASRMESNSEAYKIHVSNYCYVELIKYGKYLLEKRGTIAVKGKGEMLTWWLHGHDPAYVSDAAAIELDKAKQDTAAA